MNASEFKKLVAKHFTPEVRKLGWKGSGFNFRQETDSPVVNIFGIQGSRWGGSVCCETAIHFNFLHDLTHNQIDISKTTYASCMIRNRLSPQGEGDYHWNFRDNEEDNVKSISQILSAFKTHGTNFYNEFVDFPHPFDKITPGEIANNRGYRILGKYFLLNLIDFCWLLKEINLKIGRPAVAKEFSELGLDMMAKHVESMRAQFKGKKFEAEMCKYISATDLLFKM